MVFKVSVKCEKCKCAFELRPVEFVDREELACPNCGQLLEESVFHHLKSGLIELSKVPDTVPKGASYLPFGEGPYPEFKIEVKEYNAFVEHFGKDEN